MNFDDVMYVKKGKKLMSGDTIEVRGRRSFFGCNYVLFPTK